MTDMPPVPEELTAAVKTCVRCKTSGPVGELFGVRPLNGGWVPQAWCRACRKNVADESKAKHGPVLYSVEPSKE